jgi:hypothetical protein
MARRKLTTRILIGCADAALFVIDRVPKLYKRATETWIPIGVMMVGIPLLIYEAYDYHDRYYNPNTHCTKIKEEIRMEVGEVYKYGNGTIIERTK